MQKNTSIWVYMEFFIPSSQDLNEFYKSTFTLHI